MTETNNNHFRERFSDIGAGLIREEENRSVLPSTEGLKLDTKFDISQHNKGFAGPPIDIKGVADKVKPPGIGDLSIDADFGKLDEGIQKIKKQLIDEKIRKWIDNAQILIAERQFLSAITVLDEALDADSTSALALLLKAHCLCGLEDYNAALMSLAAARQHVHDQEMLILILMLQAACVRSITVAFESKIETLIEKRCFNQALRMVEAELLRQPFNIALIYHRCSILYLMGKSQDAKLAVLSAMQSVGQENIALFQGLLDHITFEENQHYLEAARQALRRGDTAQALKQLQPCRDVLAGNEQYEAVRAYIEEKSPRGLFSSVFSRREKILPLTEPLRETLLLWLLAEEFNTGISAMNAAHYDLATIAFSAASKIDNRCKIICFLHGLSIYNEFELALKRQEKSLDFNRIIQSLEISADLFLRASTDPNVAQQSQDLRKAVLSYQAQLKEALRERARQEEEAKSLNELVKDFNSIMENLENNPIGSIVELENAERNFRKLRQRCDGFIKNCTKEKRREILGQILSSIDRNLEQVDTIRNDIRKNEQVKVINNCVAMYNEMMEYFNSNPIKNVDDINLARKMVKNLSDMVEKARSGEGRGSEVSKVLDKLEEAIQNIKRQLRF
jgi:tetratricopeptide (TPR) repeat protein